MRLKRLSIISALWFAFIFNQAAKATVFDPKSFNLTNGLQVVVVEDHRAPVLIHMVWYKVGRADEPSGKSGIAHFLEHLMFKGTKTLAPGEFSKTIARNGGRDNAFTNQDYTGYYQEVAGDKLELVMKLESDRMANLAITDQVVGPERLVIIEERRMRTDNNPRALFGEQMTAAQYLAHPYQIPISGWLHEMQTLSRQDALDFHNRYYAPNNAILIVVGDVKTSEVRKLAEKYYGPIKPKTIPKRQRPQEPPQLAARRVLMEDARVREPSWARTYLAPSLNAGESQHAYPLIVLAEILNSSTGPLRQSLVLGDGPAVGVAAWYDPSVFDLTQFGFSATPKPGQSVEKIEMAIDQIIANFLDKGVSERDLKRAKASLDAAKIYGRDSLMSVGRAIGLALTTGSTLESLEAWPERIEAVTPEQVLAAARVVLDMRRSVTGILSPKREG